MDETDDDGGDIKHAFVSNQNKLHFKPASKTGKIITENSVVKEPRKSLRTGSNTILIFYIGILLFNGSLFCAGPWDYFSPFEQSLNYIKDKHTMQYASKMRGWYIEIYKDAKFLSSSIIVVFLNDNSEYDNGMEMSIQITKNI